MLTIDGRCLSEKNPTGVTEVAGQFIAQLKNKFPQARILTTEKSFSNSLTNLQLLLGLTSIESEAHSEGKFGAVFLPNIHFVNTEPTTTRIQVVHDLSFFHAPQWYPPRMRAWHALTRAAEQLQQAHELIAVSQWTAQGLIQHLGIPDSRVHVVHPHVPEPLQGEHPTALTIPEGAPFFLFLGTLEKRKNILGVIEAFERIKNSSELSDYHLVLAGRAGFGSPQPHELGDRVHHLSYISPDEKWWLLRNARALVYPSFFEGFGLPPLEAAAVDCPTIVSDCTAPPETMGAAALQVSPYDVKQLALAMHALAVDEMLRTQCVARGRERVAWYSKDRQLQQLQPIFKILSAHV